MQLNELNKQLEFLLPQQAPFVFVDKLLELEIDSLKTQYLIKKESIFLQQNYFQPAGIIEFMAQSAAVFVGIRALKSKSKKPPIGYIASISDLNILQLPKISQYLTTTTTISNEIGSSLIVYCKTFIENELIAESRLQLFLNDQ